VIPQQKGSEREEHEIGSDMGGAHMTEFLTAVRTRKPPSCTPEEGFKSTATVQLGMIAYETLATVKWDAATEQIVGNEQAAKLLKREYRKPYEHPYPA
jgi:hypothetical protein